MKVEDYIGDVAFSIFLAILFASLAVILIMCAILLAYVLKDEIEQHKENKKGLAKRRALNDRIKKIK